MILPEETFRLLTGYDETSNATVTNEQREAPRVPVNFHTHVVRTLRVGDDAVPIVVKLENLSRSGVRLLTQEDFRDGETFFLRLHREPDPPVWMRCRALRVERAGGGRHSIAASFHDLVSGQEAVSPAALRDVERIRRKMMD